ncbi:MAG: nucleotide sugar dehydrogenase [Rhodospirillales bacterium]|nr:nucleotide sugar dehydrogenase [Rhodospirillales bacterium]
MSHTRRLSVIGLGYVGLQVAHAFARRGDPVIAFDIDSARVGELARGYDRTFEIAAADLGAEAIAYTCDPARLAEADFHIVAVPTPITVARKPDLAPLLAATRTIGAQLRPGAIVVFESTVYPGATEEECVPVLERASKLACGRDFDVGYSPERINPGDRAHRFETIVKVIAAQNARTLAVMRAVYGSVVAAGLHEAPDIRTAEAAKAIENTQRDLNIALMNELAMICERLGLDTRDVLAAAGTKWNFLAFTPGLVGGHCVGVDPYYLTDRAERAGYHPEVILAGRRINHEMGAWIARETIKRLVRTAGRPRGRIGVLGATFKEDVPDCRNTRVADLVGELRAFGAEVLLSDPLAGAGDVASACGLAPVPLAAMSDLDAVILAVPHRAYRDGGWAMIRALLTDGRGLVVDVRACLERATRPGGVVLWRP